MSRSQVSHNLFYHNPARREGIGRYPGAEVKKCLAGWPEAFGAAYGLIWHGVCQVRQQAVLFRHSVFAVFHLVKVPYIFLLCQAQKQEKNMRRQGLYHDGAIPATSFLMISVSAFFLALISSIL